ncbi:MAG: hypothetical protein ABI990_01100 [Actinomycetota bacterium]
MSAIATHSAAAGVAVRPRRAWAAAATGAAFAFFYLIGTASLNAPHGGSDQKIVDWWSKSGHQIDALVSMYSFAIAGLVFLVFMTQMRSFLAAKGRLSEIVSSSSIVFVVMLFVSGIVRGVTGFAAKSSFGDPLPHADLLRYLLQLSYAGGSLALLAAAVAITAISLIIYRDGAFGRWLAWLGFVVSAAIVVANVFLAGVLLIPAVLIWALAMSVAMLRASRDVSPATVE